MQDNEPTKSLSQKIDEINEKLNQLISFYDLDEERMKSISVLANNYLKLSAVIRKSDEIMTARADELKSLKVQVDTDDVKQELEGLISLKSKEFHSDKTMFLYGFYSLLITIGVLLIIILF